MANKSSKREIIEWVVLIAVAGTLYFTGYHTQVIGFVQRMVLSTGIFKPTTEFEQETQANYSFQLTNVAGRNIDFQEFKGKTVFINFWATWCPPCIAEMPDIQSLYENVGEEVDFVMISVDENQFKAKQFVQDKGYDFPVYFLNSTLPSIYEARSIPTTYVISPEGVIVAERHGMAKYDSEEFRNFLLNL
ncbi:MAG: thiol-disulfide isomerase/thioredoxin [Cyclobacteriaceae bacterium]|jgi:thiol-disulfide isomerase/thioredoxin